MRCKCVTFAFSVSGASLASALAILSVKLSLRRLPTIVTMLYGAAMGYPFDAGAGTAFRSTSPYPRTMQVHEYGNLGALPNYLEFLIAWTRSRCFVGSSAICRKVDLNLKPNQ